MLRIATFNLESLDDRPRGGVDFAARIAALRPALDAIDADVLCLQEVNARREQPKAERTFGALDRVLIGTRYAGFHRAHTTHRDGTPLDRHNLVTLSRFPIRSWRSIHHDAVQRMTYRRAGSAGLRIEWDRPILQTEHAVGAQVLHVLNLHLRAPLASSVPGGKSSASRWLRSAAWAEGFFVSAVKRSGQALEARLAADAIFDRDPGALVVVAGDLNADSFEMPMRLLQAPAEEAGNPALAGRALTAVEQSVPADKRFTAIHAGRRMLVDHILVSARLAELCRDVRILNAGVRDDMVDGRYVAQPAGSFHGAIVAVFALDTPDGAS
ncbi:MAG: endonuclease/exonuclease/phosphatase family protein [Alphaproteobacteria bacterium]|nr:endonuclease/exonuclease/phosphatase family protein [Alphaproteobacteria bacterium]